jgi:hypothetical protein
MRIRKRETETHQFAERPASKATKHRPCDSRGAVANVSSTFLLCHKSLGLPRGRSRRESTYLPCRQWSLRGPSKLSSDS